MIKIKDLCSSGLFFTWTKNLKKAREGNDTGVLKKLDRVMVNEEFLKKFDQAHIIFKPYLIFDHSQAVIVILNVEEVRNKLKHIQKEIDRDPHNKALRDAKGRYQRNIIERVQNVNGDNFEGNEVADQFVLHFQKKIGQSCEVKGIDDCESLFYNSLNADEALSLVKDVSSNEIKDALFDIGDNKAPGPDGYSFMFFLKLGMSLVMISAKQLKRRQIQDNILLTQELLKCYDKKGVQVELLSKLIFRKLMIQTASFTINMNGENYGFFKGGRGLRQGDPMSPYLHFGYEMLHSDDGKKLLCHGDVKSVKVVRDSIYEFGECSGLLPNFNKSTIFFGSVKDEVQKEIMKVLPFKKGKLPMKYLGRLQLIASILESIQVYWCTVFLLPKAVLKEINNLLMGFLWCNGKLSRGKAKIAWKKICKPITHGGLGLKDLELWNKALLVKHIWNIACKKDTLWVKWISTVKLNGKNFWIVSNKSLYNARLTRDMMVADMVSNGEWVWPREWENDFPIIKQINVPKLDFEKDDWLVWKNKNNKECKFSIREAYKDIRIQSSEVIWAKLVWYCQCIPKQSFILWMAIQGKLMTCDRMAKWGSYDMTVCALCKNNVESQDHLFFNCPFSKALRKKLKTLMQFQSNATVWNDIVTELAVKPNKSSIWSIVRRLCLAGVVYSIWRERNNRVFRDEECNWEIVLEMICETARLRLMGLAVKKSKAVLQVATKWNVTLNMKVNRDAPLKQLMMEWGARANVDYTVCRFTHEGKQIQDHNTPNDFKMEDDDCIDAWTELLGGHSMI
ncbi:RNA-directed DNA polymerase, eukaryota, reverse transcriptase zinc-binding domain protein [Tanacetum coccineum]